MIFGTKQTSKQTLVDSINAIISDMEHSQQIANILKEGDFAALNAYLIQHNIKKLELGGKAKKIDLALLGQALQGTAVEILNLWGNQFSGDDAKLLCENLRGTQVTDLNLARNQIRAIGAAKLGAGLKGTAITHLNVQENYLGPVGSAALCSALVDTNVTDLDLHENNLGTAGAENVLTALAGSKVTSLNLAGNKLDHKGYQKLIPLLPHTLLVDVSLGVVHHNDFTKALKENGRRKVLLSTYFNASLNYLSDDEKRNLIKDQGVDPEKSARVNNHRFGSGIFISLPKEIQNTVLSYFPEVTGDIAKSIQDLAKGKHRQIESMDVENKSGEDMEVENATEVLSIKVKKG